MRNPVFHVSAFLPGSNGAIRSGVSQDDRDYLYRDCTASVKLVGRFVQFPVTAGDVQVSVFPPAGPETANVPEQGAPLVDVAFQVNVPEKLETVVVPETVPLAWEMAQVPETADPAWVRFITIAVKNAPVTGWVPWMVPDQFPATEAGEGARGTGSLPQLTQNTATTNQDAIRRMMSFSALPQVGW